MKNPVCSQCDRPAVSRCVGCGSYFCEKCWDEHQAEIAQAMEDADRLTSKGMHSPRERWTRRARGWDSDDPIII